MSDFWKLLEQYFSEQDEEDDTTDSAKVRDSINRIMLKYLLTHKAKCDTIDADWDESKHKRASNGQFTSGGGSSVGETEINVSESYKPMLNMNISNGTHVELPRKLQRLVDGVSKRIVKQFPVLDNYLYAIGYGNIGDGNPSQLTFHINPDGTVGQVITLDEGMWSDIKALSEFVKSESETNGHIQSNRLDAIISHEYGHLIYNSLLLKRLGYNGSGRLTPIQMNSFASELNKLDDEINSRFSDVMSKLSVRANDSASEFIAESVSNSFSGKHPRLTKSVLTWLKGEL